MTPERWLHISEVVANALERPPTQWGEFVLEACGGDDELRREVERLLYQYQQAQDFLQTLTVSVNDILHAARPGAPHLNPGDLVAGRYRIVRFIQRGGMGEVYEAEDGQGGGIVALKTIRPEIASDERVLNRFKREVLLSKQVTHPNVCRVYDLHWHRPGRDGSPTAGKRTPGPQHEFLFLTMQYLSGETLAEYIRAKGRLSPGAALPLICQMAQALDAAHSAGVIHRDFKSGNVILTPAAQAGRASRAVVTDFGLARSASVDGPSLTGPHALVGTPDYMAPEQIDKGEVSPASDLYALGVVVYEMVTGRKPFSGEASQRRKRVDELPLPPRSLVADLPRNWDRAILRSLSRRPTDRFSTAQEFASALDNPTAFSPSQYRLRWPAIAVCIAATACAAAFIAPGRLVPWRPPELARPSIAILGFASTATGNSTGDLSPALNVGLSTALRWGDELLVVPQESITRLKQDLGLTNQDAFSTETLRKIRSNVQADFVVSGSYRPGAQANDKLIWYVNLQETNGRDKVASFQLEGTQTALDDLTYRSGVRLRHELRTGPLSSKARDFIRASFPSNLTALRLYSQGIEDLRTFQYAKARDNLEQAVAADPNFAPAHSELAEVWDKLDNERKAREEAAKAYRLASNLSGEENLLIAARYWAMSQRDWKQAATAFRKLMTTYPNKLYYGLHLAQVQDSKDALATLAELRALPSPLSDDPAIDVEEAGNRESLGDYRTAEKLAAEAARKAAERGARHLEAEARFNQCYAWVEMGDSGKARAAYEAMNAIYEALGDRNGIVQAGRCLAVLREREGDFDGALRILTDSVAICQEMQSEGCAARVQRRIAHVLHDRGRLGESLRLHQASLAYYREQHSEEMIDTELLNIGTLLFLQGNMKAARQNFESALKTFRSLESPHDIAYPLLSLANLSIETGDLSSARSRAEEALAISERNSNPDRAAKAQNNLARIAFEQGEIDRARSLFKEALSTRTKIGERAAAADSQLDLATMEVEQGSPETAAALAQAAGEEFRREHRNDELALSQAVLAKALWQQGRTAQACNELNNLLPLLSGQEDRVTHISILIQAAPVQAVCRASAVAVKNLTDAFREAKQDGLLRLQLEADMELGAQELKTGKTSAGRSRLARVSDEASRIGYVRIATLCRNR